METTLAISNLMLWLLVRVLAAMVFALVRQIGILYDRVAPAGALMAASGLKTGEEIPVFDLETLAGRAIRIGGKSSNGKSTLLFFLSPTCPVCKTLIPILTAMRKSEANWLEIVFASDGDEQEHRQWLQECKLESWPYILSQQLGMTKRVAPVPCDALNDENGMLCARGLVNTRGHSESMFEAREQGVAAIQDYLQKQQQS